MSPDRVDVAVIGGGPAGASCARLLAAAGLGVALVDHEAGRLSRAELISARARWWLRDHDLCGVDVHETLSWWGGDAPVIRDAFWDPYGPALAIERSELDAALRGQAVGAGAMLVTRRITSLVRTGDRWHLGDGLVADWVVIATGCGLPALGRGGRTLLAQRAVLARYRHDGPPRLCIERTAGGWLYGLPDPAGGTLVGLCTAGPGDLDAALRSSRLLGEVGRATRSRPWSCSASVRAYARVAGPRWLAVGNAAFAPDPLSGGGLWFALETARTASGVVLGHTTAEAYEAYVGARIRGHLASRQAVLADGVPEAVQP
jgi:flavin-dependent dehydrogenase